MKYTAFLLSVLLLVTSCREQKECDTPLLPPAPVSPILRLVDRATGDDVFEAEYMADSVKVLAACAPKAGISSLEDADGIGCFVIKNITFDEDRGGCTTAYLKLSATDEDTLMVEGKGHTYNNNDPCGGNYEFVVTQMHYNGLEASKEKDGRGREYYLLKK